MGRGGGGGPNPKAPTPEMNIPYCSFYSSFKTLCTDSIGVDHQYHVQSDRVGIRLVIPTLGCVSRYVKMTACYNLCIA